MNILQKNKFLLVSFCLIVIVSAQAYGAQQIQSVWAPKTPVLDGIPQAAEWEPAVANKLQLHNGWLLTQNDTSMLYILIDLTRDTHNDPPLKESPWGDYFSLTVDVNGDKRITPNVDMSYGFYPGSHKLGFQFYLRPSAWTGLKDTHAKLGAGFGSSMNSPAPHRIWEIGIPLNEIGGSPGKSIRVGIATSSQNPIFHDYYPTNFMNDFSDLIEISLSREMLHLVSPPFRVLEPQEISGNMTIATLNERFQVGSFFGDRDRYKLTIERHGQLNLQAAWRGTAKELALILNGPGQEGYYARKDGESPLKIDFEITQELLKRGSEWTVSIVNFSKAGSAAGTLSMEYPVESRKLQELKPADLNKFRITGLVLGTPSGGKIKRTILEDGTVEIRYPDGTIKRLFKGGFTVVSPTGEANAMLYVQVQPNTPPSLPGDESIVAWLEMHSEGLLNLIRKLVDGDETAVNYYLQEERENAGTLYEKIDLRRKCIGKLLTPQ